MDSDKRIEILLWQYRECLSFIRSYNSLIWQTPSLTIAINSFLGILYLGYAKTFEARIMLLFASLSFTFVATIALQKHRFFQVAKSDEFRLIQEELLKEIQNIRELKLETMEIYNDIKNYPSPARNFWTRRRAYTWLLFIMYATMVFILTIIVIEGIRLIT
jgi:hypothetical protein